MNEELISGVKVISSSTNYFAKKDKSATFEGKIYLGKFDSKDNYIEITKAEKEAIDKQIEDAKKLAKEQRELEEQKRKLEEKKKLEEQPK